MKLSGIVLSRCKLMENSDREEKKWNKWKKWPVAFPSYRTPSLHIFPGDTYWSIDNSFVVDISISELLCQYYEYPLHSDIFSFSLKAPRKKKREKKVILSACSKMFLYLQNIFFEASVKKWLRHSTVRNGYWSPAWVLYLHIRMTEEI